MKTAIQGKVRIKLFWGCDYDQGKMERINQIWRIGKLLIWKVVYATGNPFEKSYWKSDVMQELQRDFDVRWEKTPGDEGDYWYAVYSHRDGGYVGTPENAYRLVQRGLRLIQKAGPDGTTCSIGYNPENRKWYGWSHRAMYGFKIGDTVKEGDCCASSGWTEEYLKDHPDENRSLPVGFVANNSSDCKRMAIAFAESVS